MGAIATRRLVLVACPGSGNVARFVQALFGAEEAPSMIDDFLTSADDLPPDPPRPGTGLLPETQVPVVAPAAMTPADALAATPAVALAAQSPAAAPVINVSLTAIAAGVLLAATVVHSGTAAVALSLTVVSESASDDSLSDA